MASRSKSTFKFVDKVPEAELDNYFLVSMVDQWAERQGPTGPDPGRPGPGIRLRDQPRLAMMSF